MYSTKLTKTQALEEQTEIRRRLLTGGYVPIPSRGKRPCNAWKGLQLDPAQIDAMADQRRWQSTGVRIEGGLVALDFDIDDDAALQAIWQAVPADLADLLDAMPQRHGAGFKIALFARLADGEKPHDLKSGAFARPGEDRNHRVEIFTGESLRFFGLFGPHSFDDAGQPIVTYRWAGASLADTPLASLHTITVAQIETLCRIATQVLQGMGWQHDAAASLAASPGRRAYDLTAAMRFNVRDRGQMTLADLEAAAQCEDSLRCTASFIEGASATNETRCLVGINPGDGRLQIHDTAHDCLHRPADLDTRNLTRDLAARLEARGLLEPGAGGAFFSESCTIDDTPEAPPEPLMFKPASSYEGVPVKPRRWLVEGLVPSNTVTLLSGDGGTGKSLLALQLAVATGTAGGWLGRKIDTPGPALFLSAEDDDDEIHRRMKDVSAAGGVPWAHLDEVHLLSLAGKEALLATLQQGGKLQETDLFKSLDQAIAAHAPALVVLDTLADLFPGNENDRAQARQFVGMLRGLAIRHECAVILLSHPSLTGLNSGTGTSGSTGWNNSVRSRLYLERVKEDGFEADPDARVLRGMKANYGRIGDEIALRWESGVFVSEGPSPAGMNPEMQEHRAREMFLKLLDEHTAQGRYVKAAKAAGYAPKEFVATGRAGNFNKAQLHRAMEQLFKMGKIVQAKGGDDSPSKQKLRIVRAE